MPVVVPCGKCIGCRLEKSRQWAVRCIHEAKLHKRNCFITLTYEEDKLPLYRTKKLTKDNQWARDYVLFMKKLRKEVGKVRFFHCGEYGEDGMRPHHHACLFGWEPKDLQIFKKDQSIVLYKSEQLQKIWEHGFVTIGELNFETAAYVSRYVTKKINGDKAEKHYRGRKPEYCTMSRNRGIGFEFASKYRQDITSLDAVIIKELQTRPPRYYDNILYTQPELEELKGKRSLKVNNAQNTEARLKDREQAKMQSIRKLTRKLENLS